MKKQKEKEKAIPTNNSNSPKNTNNNNCTNQKSRPTVEIPIHHATKCGNLEELKQLLLIGPNQPPSTSVNALDTQGKSALFFASARGDHEIVRFLIQQNADPNLGRGNKATCPLSTAIQQGRFEVVRLLVEGKADLQRREVSEPFLLHLACKTGNVQIVTFLLQRRAYLHDTDKIGNSALHMAAVNGRAEIVKLLLKKKASPSILNKHRNSALQLACQKGYLEVVKELFEIPFDPKRDPDQQAENCTVEALSCGHFSIVKFLIQKKALANFADKNGQSLLFHAASNGNPEIVNFLLNSAADITQGSGHKAPLVIAAQKGHFETVCLLIQKNASLKPGKDVFSPLFAASENGHEDIVKFLLQSRAKANSTSQGNTPLWVAASRGHLKVAELLVNAQAKINEKTHQERNSPLWGAAACGHENLVAFLLAKKAKPTLANKFGVSPFEIASVKGHEQIALHLIRNNNANKQKAPVFIAARDGHLEVVKSLLQNKAKVNEKADSGHTPLWVASRSGHADVVKLLVDSNAHTSSNEETPLAVACWEGHKAVVEVLAQSRAQLDVCRSVDGQFPLLIAAKTGRLPILKCLVENKASVNQATPASTITPLFVACKKGRIDAVKFLLDNNALVSPQNTLGKLSSPLRIAAQKNHIDLVGLLLKHGGDPKDIPDKSQIFLQALRTGNSATLQQLFIAKALLPKTYLSACYVPGDIAMLSDLPTLAQKLYGGTDSIKFSFYQCLKDPYWQTKVQEIVHEHHQNAENASKKLTNSNASPCVFAFHQELPVDTRSYLVGSFVNTFILHLDTRAIETNQRVVSAHFSLWNAKQRKLSHKNVSLSMEQCKELGQFCKECKTTQHMFLPHSTVQIIAALPKAKRGVCRLLWLCHRFASDSVFFYAELPKDIFLIILDLAHVVSQSLCK